MFLVLLPSFQFFYNIPLSDAELGRRLRAAPALAMLAAGVVAPVRLVERFNGCASGSKCTFDKLSG